MKKLLAIPLLPANKAQEAVDLINDDIDKLFADDPYTKKKWKKFVNFYFVKQWMKTVSPEVFSVFKSIDRTNNYLESYHRTINSICYISGRKCRKGIVLVPGFGE